MNERTRSSAIEGDLLATFVTQQLRVSENVAEEAWLNGTWRRNPPFSQAFRAEFAAHCKFSVLYPRKLADRLESLEMI